MNVSGQGSLAFDVDAGEEHQRADRGRPFYPKRTHKKSRKGCINCKTRKVKCDEGLPSCRKCSLRNDRCVYAPAPSASRSQARRPFTIIQTTFPPPSNSSSSSSGSPHPTNIPPAGPVPLALSPPPSPPDQLRPVRSLGVLPPTAHYDAVDMKLLWNYTAKSIYSFVADEQFQELTASIYRTEVVGLAFDAPFLMDSILAVSCLELHKADPNLSLSRAYKYHVRAIEGYNHAIREAKPETLSAILVNSIFVGILTSHTFRDPNSKDLYIAEWLAIWRGTGTIVELVGFDAIHESKLGIICYRPPIDVEASSYAIPHDLQALISSIPPEDDDYPSLVAYGSVLKLLGSLYHHLRLGLGADLDQRITTWFTSLPRAFAVLGQQYRPRALIIIAHFVCFFKLIKQVWWIEGVADRSIRDIYKYLDPTWRPLLRVPMAVLPLTDKVTVARILLEDPDWVNPKRSREQIGGDFLFLSEEDPLAAAGLLLQVEQEKDNEQDLEVDTEISRQMSSAHI